MPIRLVVNQAGLEPKLVEITLQSTINQVKEIIAREFEVSPEVIQSIEIGRGFKKRTITGNQQDSLSLSDLGLTENDTIIINMKKLQDLKEIKSVEQKKEQEKQLAAKQGFIKR